MNKLIEKVNKHFNSYKHKEKIDSFYIGRTFFFIMDYSEIKGIIKNDVVSKTIFLKFFYWFKDYDEMIDVLDNEELSEPVYFILIG